MSDHFFSDWPCPSVDLVLSYSFRALTLPVKYPPPTPQAPVIQTRKPSENSHIMRLLYRRMPKKYHTAQVETETKGFYAVANALALVESRE